ncbi:MAG TPA: DUF4198 domain-containing protein [Gemmatimonadaceae bacterium]
MPKSKSALAVALALVCAAALAGAHETWILPSTMRVATGHPVTLSLTSGMAFPADDFAIDPKRVALAEIRLNGKLEQLRGGRSRPTALRFTWIPRVPGVATIAVELAPKTLVLQPKLIEEYFQEIHAGASIRAQWDSIPKPKQWRESYIKHATSFVRVGAPTGDSSWASPLGLGLEIVPERDPTVLVAGDVLPVRVLRHGAPLSGFAVGARREGQSTESFVTTDPTGRVSVPLPGAGRWLLFGTDLRRAKEPGLEWRSDFVTATIGVRAKR